MPVSNEAETIRETLAQMLAVPIEKEILIVDDRSTDGTREVLRDLGGRDDIRTFPQPTNPGKGATVSVGRGEENGRGGAGCGGTARLTPTAAANVR